MTLFLQLVASLLLVAANAFFVAVEFAIARVRTTQVDELESEGKPGARSLRHAVENIDAYLAACQLGITVASIGLGVVGKPAFERLLEPVFGDIGGDAAYVLSFAFAFGIVTLLHVVLGELAPKSLAISRNVTTALAIAVPMRLFYLSTKPLVDFFNFLGNLVLKPFGIPPAREVGHAPHTERELRMLLGEAEDRGEIQEAEEEMLYKVFDFADKEVHEVMVPRPEVVAVSVDLPPEDALAALVDSPYTRYPAYRGSLDEIVGILHVRDLFSALHDRGLAQVDVGELLRAPFVVPETKDLAALLADFRRTKQHMAIVVDEYGAMEGIVTLEDLLEEIVGEIEDEYDLPDESVERIDDQTIRVGGTFPIDDFNEQFGTALPDEDYHTIAGFVFGALGRAPEEGDTIEHDGVRFEVLEVEGTRIERLQAEFELAAPEPSTLEGAQE